MNKTYVEKCETELTRKLNKMGRSQATIKSYCYWTKKFLVTSKKKNVNYIRRRDVQGFILEYKCST